MSKSNNNANNMIDTDSYIKNLINSISHTEPENRKKSHADMVCAPGLKYEAGSCAKLSVLIELAKAYNITASDKDKIILSNNMELLNPQKYKLYLVKQLEKRIGDKCTTQKCWGKQEFIMHMREQARNEFLYYTHRPNTPQGKFEWLNTFDINDAVNQYYTLEKKAKFFGAVPMDFATLDYEISDPRYNEYYKNGIRKLGIVFNLDDHDEPGSHWTAMFTDFDNGLILYFDSYGIKPEARVRALMRKQFRFMQDIGLDPNKIRVDYNKVRHQRENSECGVYSINFLVRMLRGDDFDKLCNNPVHDRDINKCRRVYFDKYTKRRKY